MNERRLPYNEFSEHCTGDMHDMDVTYHHWLQEKWKAARQWYKKNRIRMERSGMNKAFSENQLPRDVVRYDSMNFIKDGREEHPCPDNHKMVAWVIDMWTREGETVLDPFMGSGTTAVMAERYNRNWIGIEVNPEFVSLANRRLVAQRGQGVLALDNQQYDKATGV